LEEKTDEANPVHFSDEEHKQLNAGDSPIRTEDDDIREQLEKNFSGSTNSTNNKSDSSIQADPDESRELKIAWDQWHKRVGAAIYARFNFIAREQFADKPLRCRIACSITRDGRIINIRLLQKSPNLMFNSSLLMMLTSIKENSILQFPPGSRKQIVEKTIDFTNKNKRSTLDPASLPPDLIKM